MLLKLVQPLAGGEVEVTGVIAAIAAEKDPVARGGEREGLDRVARCLGLLEELDRIVRHAAAGPEPVLTIELEEGALALGHPPSRLYSLEQDGHRFVVELVGPLRPALAL